MAVKKSDPWYVPLPDSRSDPAMLRYNRAKALSEMRRYLEIYERNPDAAKNRADTIEYRRYCLSNWQLYLDGGIDPPTGRKPKGEDTNKGGRPPKDPTARFQRKTVTLPPSLVGAIEALQKDDEDFSSTLQRILSSHPAVAAVAKRLKELRK